MASLRRGDREPRTRFEDMHHDFGNPLVLKPDHPVIREARTLFPKTVRDPKPTERLLKPGTYQTKIGPHVTKGKWKDFPIYVLTLEERATCSATCQHFLDCYGNKMRWAKRYRYSPTLITQLESELELLSLEHPGGLVVRLHELGDFPDTRYVAKWSEWLDRFPQVHCFGYTHWMPGSEVGDALKVLIDTRWERFAIRWSDHTEESKCAITITPTEAEGRTTVRGAVICPEQQNRTKCCGTCGICWDGEMSIGVQKGPPIGVQKGPPLRGLLAG